MQEYLYLIHPFRHNFFTDPKPEEDLIMEEHFHYLRTGADKGIVLLAGPCLDDTFGLVVFRAEDDHAAKAFMFDDPSVKKNIMAAELHPMRVSVKGNLELKS